MLPSLTSNPAAVLDKRYEIVLLFEVSNGNPNGDPDGDNTPRIDPETGHGLVTDVCLKRKVRNFVALTRDCEPPYDIYVKERGILANEQKKAFQAIGEDASDTPNLKARAWMCKNFFDVRTFGAVMSTGKTDEGEDGAKGKSGKKQKLWNCGQVRGPVQFSFSRSIDRIQPLTHTITRVALTNSSDRGGKAVSEEGEEEKAGSGQMGRKHGVPYGLYRAHIFVSPFLAADTGFNNGDMAVLLDSLTQLFELDRSASRGEMAVRGLYLFEHELKLGNAPAHKVLETVKVQLKPGVTAPRSFSDYEVTAPDNSTPAVPGVTCYRLVS
ncbi:MAG: type I-C CRISPR-associated protein Cas7/Csd2 [Acidobacteria bacterium]|nr:type I-C CRISPR-associated protein Cas7/Csd2 [Acidobacteriota bacterium]